MKKALTAILAAGSFLLSAGCNGSPIQSAPHEPVAMTAWVADWDMKQGMTEYGQIQGNIEHLSYFAARFQKDGSLMIPESITQGRQGHEQSTDYLTVVNDAESGKGDIRDKDLEVLHKVLKNKKSRAQHIQELLSLVEDNGYGGLEIDYERVFKDKELIGKYLDFLQELNVACQEKNIHLRAILEPGMDFGAGFPEGPEYVVMLYNLYGTHSNAGPKANGSFIEKTIERMAALPGDKGVALSTGGCMWEARLLKLKHDKGKFINEAKAISLQQQFKAETQRDPESACLYFDYTDKGSDYTIWYADSETINAWITVAANKGIKSVSLWRLGGNTDVAQIDASGK